jgi:hypothetical protein
VLKHRNSFGCVRYSSPGTAVTHLLSIN